MKDSTLDGAAEHIVKTIRNGNYQDAELMLALAADIINDLASRNKELVYHFHKLAGERAA